MTLYVTGTDTGIGKTHVSRMLLVSMAARGMRVLGMKPVASGCVDTAEGLRNEDANLLRAAGSTTVDYADVNPYAFAEPIAPHLAAAASGTRIDLATITAAYGRLGARADVVVVEGVGGWAAPLGERLDQGDVVRALGLDVVLVVGLRLGCINHARLSVAAIAADRCRLVGWIGNRIDPDMVRAEENIATLRARIRAPMLGVVGHGEATVNPHLTASLCAAIA